MTHRRVRLLLFQSHSLFIKEKVHIWTGGLPTVWSEGQQIALLILVQIKLMCSAGLRLPAHLQDDVHDGLVWPFQRALPGACPAVPGGSGGPPDLRARGWPCRYEHHQGTDLPTVCQQG